MHEHRRLVLENKAKADDERAFSGGADMRQALSNQCASVLELSAEVARLEGRLEAVCDVLSDADAFDGVVHQEKVMDAVRGYRQATMEEAKAKLSGSAVDDDVLLKWIIDWKITVHTDGKLVIDDLTGLAYAMMGGSAWRLN